MPQKFETLNMKNSFALIVILAAVFSFSSCKNEPKVESPELVEAPIQKVSYYMTSVDNLRARAGEDKSSEVVDKLPEHTMVKDLGERSQSTETITLRGVKHTEPYRKVALPSGDEVWVYGGGLTKFYEGAEIGDTKKVAELQDLLNNLSVTDKSSGNTLLKRLLQISSDDPATNDLLFFLSKDYLQKLAYNASLNDEKELEWAKPYYESISSRAFDPSSVSQGKSIVNNALLLDASEGMIYYSPDYKALDGAIGGVFTPATKEYIQLISEVYDHRLFSDAAIVGDYDVLASDAGKWKAFVTKYPDYSKIKDAQQVADHLKLAVLRGTNNTPAVNFESKKLDPRFRAMWQKIIEDKNHPLRDEVMAEEAKH